jgi:hypothetical protein
VASGDKLLDADGNVILDDDGDVHLSDGVGDDCCCGEYEEGVPCTDCTAPTPATISVEFAGTDLCACNEFAFAINVGASGSIDGTYDLTQDGSNPCCWDGTFPGVVTVTHYSVGPLCSIVNCTRSYDLQIRATKSTGTWGVSASITGLNCSGATVPFIVFAGSNSSANDCDDDTVVADDPAGDCGEAGGTQGFCGATLDGAIRRVAQGGLATATVSPG